MSGPTGVELVLEVDGLVLCGIVLVRDDLEVVSVCGRAIK